MSPPSAIRFDSDFSPAMSVRTARTLILSPPALASRPEVLEAALTTAGKDAADVQMIDRLALNHVSLPAETYTSVLQLSDGTSAVLTPTMLAQVLAAMAPGARWKCSGDAKWGADRMSFLSAGFLIEEGPDGVEAVKPDFGGQKSVTLNFRKRPATTTANGGVVKPVVVRPVVAAPPVVVAAPKPQVGFVDFSDDFDDEDDELIDEDELMADEKLETPVHIRESTHPVTLCYI